MAALGERILAELDDSRTNNTLTRWLCHHVAGLIDTADQARAAGTPDADVRAAEARTAILQVWQHRSAWPVGWPPPHAAEIVRLLDDLPDLPDRDGASSHRDSVINHLHNLHHHILATLFDLVTSEGTSVEQGWLDTFGDQLTPGETTLLARAAATPQRLNALQNWWDRTSSHRTVADLAPDNDTSAGQDASNGDRADDGHETHPLIELAEAYRDTIVDLCIATASTEPNEPSA